jgi:hypothetical protein
MDHATPSFVRHDYSPPPLFVLVVLVVLVVVVVVPNRMIDAVNEYDASFVDHDDSFVMKKRMKLKIRFLVLLSSSSCSLSPTFDACGDSFFLGRREVTGIMIETLHRFFLFWGGGVNFLLLRHNPHTDGFENVQHHEYKRRHIHPSESSYWEKCFQDDRLNQICVSLVHPYHSSSECASFQSMDGFMQGEKRRKNRIGIPKDTPY